MNAARKTNQPSRYRSGKSIPDAQRKRKRVMITLSPEARAELEWLAESGAGGMSGAVERLILAAAYRLGRLR